MARIMGVHINMVTKSGTNQLHGAVLEFLRNQVLDARTFFTLPTPANPTAAKPPLRQNQFGFELDGPVVFPNCITARTRRSSWRRTRVIRTGAVKHVALDRNAGRFFHAAISRGAAAASPAAPSRIR